MFLAGMFSGMPVLAVTEINPPFSVSARYGTITDFYPAAAAKNGEINLRNTPFVVLIQDLHANVGVQKNIAATLYRLNQTNKMGSLLVCVEGASGEGDVSLLRSLPGPIRHSFEAMLLRKAYLTGAELAATEEAADWYQQKYVITNRIMSMFSSSNRPQPVTLSPIRLWGVDDPELYRKNWRAAKYVDKNRYEALQYLKSTRAMLKEGGSKVLQDHLDLVVKLLLLRLQPQEYKDYLKHRSLNPGGPEAYQATLEAAETYYVAANKRSDAMTKNLLNAMRFHPGITAMITGGFHTQEIAANLKQKNIPYLVITPRVEVLDQDEAYRARLREEE
jgi:hypothetical protein